MVFRSRETTNKLPPKIYRAFEVRRNVRIFFGRSKDSLKGKYYVFSHFKQRKKMCSVYLECKLQQDSYG